MEMAAFQFYVYVQRGHFYTDKLFKFIAEMVKLKFVNHVCVAIIMEKMFLDCEIFMSNRFYKF